MLQSETVSQPKYGQSDTGNEKEVDQMPAQFQSLTQSERWYRLVEAAKRALRERGYDVVRMPGRGLSNMFKITKAGKTELAAIRTTQDRYFAFNPTDKGGWKTLDEVEYVVIAAVDTPGAVQKFIVHMFPAADVRQRFSDALKARLAAGYEKKDFAMWIALDADPSGSPVSVGSGIAEKYAAIGVYSANEATLPASGMQAEGSTAAVAPALNPTSIAEVLQKAREQVAVLAGVPVQAVTLELKIGS
jgi:hypothetical protein